ncbi:MAG: hypothetical protein WC285_01285 [Candidatus Gracilibacteria bacterium]|jgi:hypothetical protein
MSTHGNGEKIGDPSGTERRSPRVIDKIGKAVRRTVDAIRNGVRGGCRAVVLGLPLIAGGLGLIAPNSASANAPTWRGAECAPVPGIGEGLRYLNSVKVYTGPDGRKYSLVSARQSGIQRDIFMSDFTDGMWSTPARNDSLSTTEWDGDVAVYGNTIYLIRGSDIVGPMAWDGTTASPPAESAEIQSGTMSGANAIDMFGGYMYGSNRGIGRFDISADPWTFEGIPSLSDDGTYGMSGRDGFAIVSEECNDTNRFACEPNIAQLYVFEGADRDWTVVPDSNVSPINPGAITTSPFVDSRGVLWFVSGDTPTSGIIQSCAPVCGDGVCLGTADCEADCPTVPPDDGGVTPDAGADGGTPPDPDAGVDGGGVPDPDAGADGGGTPPDPDAGADGGVPDAGADAGVPAPDAEIQTPDAGCLTSVPGIEVDAGCELELCGTEGVDPVVIRNLSGRTCTVRMDVRRNGTPAANIIMRDICEGGACNNSILACVGGDCIVPGGDVSIDDNGQGIVAKPEARHGVMMGIVGTVYRILSYIAANGHEIFEVECSQGHIWVDFTQVEGDPRVDVGDCEMCVDKVIVDLTTDTQPETFVEDTDGGVVYDDGGETNTDGGVVYEDGGEDATDGGTVHADAEVIPPDPGNGGGGCSCSVEGEYSYEGGDSSDPSALIFGMAAAVGARVRGARKGKNSKKNPAKKI